MSVKKTKDYHNHKLLLTRRICSIFKLCFYRLYYNVWINCSTFITITSTSLNTNLFHKLLCMIDGFIVNQSTVTSNGNSFSVNFCSSWSSWSIFTSLSSYISWWMFLLSRLRLAFNHTVIHISDSHPEKMGSWKKVLLCFQKALQNYLEQKKKW